MKKEIHPKYEKVIIKCACGNEIETKSTVGGEIHVELCSVCHPFYTGKQKFIDSAGRVDKFRAKLEAAKEKTKFKAKKTDLKENEQKSNVEKLNEIKDAITPTPETPKEKSTIEIGEPTNSSEELSAAEELKINK